MKKLYNVRDYLFINPCEIVDFGLVLDYNTDRNSRFTVLKRQKAQMSHFIGNFEPFYYVFIFVLFLEFVTLKNFFIYFCVSSSLAGWNPNSSANASVISVLLNDGI